MKAWISSSYGKDGDPADAVANLKLANDVPVPKPGKGEFLIKISHAAVNPIDWKLFSGGMHGICPCTHPYTPGFDFAGTVVELGPSSEDSSQTFSVNDVVCGDIGLVETCTDPPPKQGCCGAFAEYCVVPANVLVKIPTGVSESTAAALPLAGLTALQGVFTRSARSLAGETLGNLKPTTENDDDKASKEAKKVLILGGATLVGSYAIQLAKLAGAYVATTASTNLMPDGTTTKIAFCETNLGADKVIDYQAESWSVVLFGEDFDLIYDTIGAQDDWKNASKVLKTSADFISVANFSPDATANAENNFKNYLIKSVGTPDLKELMDFVESGKLICSIDSIVPFANVPEALMKSLRSANAGKIVVKVA